MNLTGPGTAPYESALFQDKMRTYLLPEQFKGEDELVITGKEYHYLIHVLRLKENTVFKGQDHKGNFFSLRISAIAKKSLTIVCIPDSITMQKNLPDITLYQCICKGKKMDRIIRQAAETGVRRIIPLFSEHTVPRMHEKEIENKNKRWARVIREAVQQSGSGVITEITYPVSLMMFDKKAEKSEINLFFHQDPLENRSLHEYLCEYPASVSLLIGPEGGLSDKEILFLKSSGFSPVLLKTNILRAETAAIYAISAVQNILTEREHWQPITH